MTTAQAATIAPPTITPWPDAKRWAYSITFDEGLSELHQFTIPILAEYGVPGHVEVVVGQMGEVRRIGASSYNGYHHMGGPELRELLARGWGVGNHSWTHEVVTPETVDLELGKAKQVLEDAIGEPVTIYCSSGDNTNMNADALAACKRYGYLGAMSITDALNRPADPDLLWMNRTFLHTQGYGPFFSEFDPLRNIAHAKRDQGWIIDYLHCPFEQAVHPNKDCSAAELRARVETICSEGGSDVWLARIEDAVDYRYTRRAAKIEALPGGGDPEFIISAPGINPAVRKRTVTLELPKGVWAVDVDEKRSLPTPHGGKLLLNVDLAKPRKLRLRVARATP